MVKGRFAQLKLYKSFTMINQGSRFIITFVSRTVDFISFFLSLWIYLWLAETSLQNTRPLLCHSELMNLIVVD